jgi:hypothetical protein
MGKRYGHSITERERDSASKRTRRKGASRKGTRRRRVSSGGPIRVDPAACTKLALQSLVYQHATEI